MYRVHRRFGVHHHHRCRTHPKYSSYLQPSHVKTVTPSRDISEQQKGWGLSLSLQSHSLSLSRYGDVSLVVLGRGALSALFFSYALSPLPFTRRCVVLAPVYPPSCKRCKVRRKPQQCAHQAPFARRGWWLSAQAHLTATKQKSSKRNEGQRLVKEPLRPVGAADPKFPSPPRHVFTDGRRLLRPPPLLWTGEGRSCVRCGLCSLPP